MRPRDWLKDIRNLSPEQIIVRHLPPTDRYMFSAAAALQRVLTSGEVLGWRELSGEPKKCIEVVVWTSSLNRGECGLYVCCRLHYGDKQSATSATIFCFYDGTEKSPCFKGKSEAIQAMKKWALTHKTRYTE